MCLITAFRASRGWNASEVLLYTSSFDSCGKNQEARDSLVPNCYKVISIRCISVYLYVLYVCDVVQIVESELLATSRISFVYFSFLF